MIAPDRDGGQALLSEQREQAFAAWCDLRAIGGARVTILRLYELLADQRGIAPHELDIAELRLLAQRAWASLWAGFELLPMSERGPEPIELVDYDDSWPARFDEWRGRLAEELGTAARLIEHVGSTSIPGLVAKPVVDIQMSVDHLDDEDSYVPACERTGLQLRSRDEEHRYFRPPPDRLRDVHLHVCEVGSGWERVHLLFRDYLREHGSARDSYAAMKQRAAAMWRDDRLAYTEAKSELILDLLGDAEMWAATVGWSLPV